MMELEEPVTRGDRMDPLTTAKDSRKIINLMQKKDSKETADIHGGAVF